jgi:outer membrane protein
MTRHKQTREAFCRYAEALIILLVCCSLNSCLIPSLNPPKTYVGPPQEPLPLQLEEQLRELKETPELEPVPPTMALSTGSPLEITIPDAVLLALANNYEFQIRKLDPSVRYTAEEEERARFDPVFAADGQVGQIRADSTKTTKGFNASATATTFLPTGTTVVLGANADEQKDNLFTNDPNSNYSASVDLTITQALLRGAGTEVNLASLRQARLDTRASEYELRGLAQALCAEVENTYWDHLMAEQEAGVYRKSLELANRLIRETRERIALGQLASTEIYFAQAEAAVREQNLINAMSVLEKTRLQLLQRLNPPGTSLWNRQVKLLTIPEVVPYSIAEVAMHLKLAERLRPDLNQARLAIQRGDLEIVKTKNGLLPRLDLFAMLGRTGYSRTFDRAVRDIGANNGGLDIFVGLTFEYPMFNRKAKARFQRSTLELTQEKEALRNLAQLAEEDVLSANVEINRTGRQIRASRITCEYQEKKLQAEMDRYREGVSTMFRVAQAERDLVLSQVSQVQARIDYLKAFTQFYLADGSLLVRRGIEAPGLDPVVFKEPNPGS